MPSPAPAADLERVLHRAAAECASADAVWFGEGLPRSLKSALDAAGKTLEETGAELAFVEVGGSVAGAASPGAHRVVALSVGGLEELASLARACRASKPPVARLICPVAVLDFITEGVRVREIRHGLTAADLQERLGAALFAGPDLKELGTH
jgi:hypothetical protein